MFCMRRLHRGRSTVIAVRQACDAVSTVLKSRLSEVLQLTKELQELDTTGVLLGDHNIKLVRQAYFLGKQEQV